MARLTVNLADHVYRALKDAAARQHRSMGAILEEYLAMGGIGAFQGRTTAKDIAARARAASGLEADQAAKLAVEETKRFREERQAPTGGVGAATLDR